ncbi:hypothetical protein XENOCAPTIV_010201 [Xenoophorus captivus]|uniref:Uncharacterized protein n=1 Tax=Xenoophorus captivus TaxID=1517983 RepID=A0ABV0QHJ8_9TELE
MRGLVRPADVSQCFSLHSARHQQSRPSLPTHTHDVFSFLIGSQCSGSATFSACCVDSDTIQELGLVIWRPSLCFGAGHETWRSGVVNSSACTFQHQYRMDSSQTDQTELFRRLACFGFDSRCCYVEKNLFFFGSGSDSSGGNPKRRGFVCLGGKKKAASRLKRSCFVIKSTLQTMCSRVWFVTDRRISQEYPQVQILRALKERCADEDVEFRYLLMDQIVLTISQGQLGKYHRNISTFNVSSECD